MATPTTPLQTYVTSGYNASSGVDTTLLNQIVNPVSNALTENLTNLNLPPWENILAPAETLPAAYGIVNAGLDTVAGAVSQLPGISTGTDANGNLSVCIDTTTLLILIGVGLLLFVSRGGSTSRWKG